MRVWVQVIALFTMLGLGIFVGIDLAERNMHKMQGTEGAERAIQITPKDGKIEISVFGQVIETRKPDDQALAKNESVTIDQPPKEGTNYLALVGNQLGTAIRQVLRKLADLMFVWTQS
ncbi:DUF3679 domain-containing protein [Thermoactinomyces mirandus]|uniref:DUF3679 domain-containing protein n=1 Tax=Thermoactinomyces mirandus TaxID=2756294 RepID=A0A7W1XPF5_9BACL|nr:DUF3679 domain-containing protein [Thermoactinomyces mirandus]MBA4600776.1 DUF3679 domain-containing protein [Thermoactinomyces mirandus]